MCCNLGMSLPPLKSAPLTAAERAKLQQLLARDRKSQAIDNVTSIEEHRADIVRGRHRREMTARIDAAIANAISTIIPDSAEKFVRVSDPGGTAAYAGRLVSTRALRDALQTTLGRIRAAFISMIATGKFDPTPDGRDPLGADIELAFQLAAQHTAEIFSRTWRERER